jgi:hypothetical protein
MYDDWSEAADDEVHDGSGAKPCTCTAKAASDENGQREEQQRPWRRPHTHTPRKPKKSATNTAAC